MRLQLPITALPSSNFLARTTTYRNVAERAAFRPVALAVAAEVSRLVHAVVVVVAKLGVHGLATGARYRDSHGPLTHAPTASPRCGTRRVLISWRSRVPGALMDYIRVQILLTVVHS